MVLPFDKVKRVLDEACREWDEHIFIAGDSPFQTVSLIGEDQSEVEVVFGPLHGPRRYVFPLSECKILPCDNITSEWLAVLLAQKCACFPP
ncbi:hypothetical protein H696_03524 [Fonticula alba]|uniref:Uncharacterized protein n=1 Tax=Fonticula alba TaxID=691883 RepID=A0A058Z7I6_FONAL|nr:hypothetical protein H696_03524 [Fonticula alba]KCV70061.1 hypothetical protein H696_03524 [Fonticula alba]|eukprot:XP_009495667.1 hypothetical protein H696_03524 [Fonticula alba]